MHKQCTNKTILAVTISLFMALFVAPAVFAQEATSSNFMTNATFNLGGGSGTSSSFSADQSINQSVSGESTSTNFLLDSGSLSFDSFSPKQQNWRWYDDQSDETPSVPLDTENVSPSGVDKFNTMKLRVSVAETAGIGANNLKFRLQYATTSDFSSGAYNVVESADCTGSSSWCYANGAGADNAVITTKVLSDADSCSSGVGDGCGTHNTSGISTTTFTQQKSTITEYEFTIQGSGAETNTVYFFRLFDNTAGTPVPLNTGATYPSLSTNDVTLTFTIGGLAASTVTSGTTTTIDTTSSNVPFGSMLGGGSALGAQRLTVTTNAAQGYEIFSFAQQGFVGSYTDEIPPITGTNNSPLGWTTACSLTSTGCYGYHTSEAVLSGGSTRFAADDTYAKFSTTTPDEVAYSSGPATAKDTDIVYKTEIHNLQSADSYSTSVVYIVVPTF